MHDKAWLGFDHLGARMQDHTAFTVLQDGMEGIVGFGAGALTGQIQPQVVRHTEQLHALIQQMRTQVIPQAATRYRLLAPAITDLRTEAVEMRLKMVDIAQLTTLADGVVYVSGTLPFDKDNNVVFINDPKAQTRHVLETIKTVIETAGGTMEDVTFNSIFITDWKNYAAINEIYAEFFPGDKPARFCIQCGLVKPEALVEIATVAHIAK